MFKDPVFMQKLAELKRRYEEDKKSHYLVDRKSLGIPKSCKRKNRHDSIESSDYSHLKQLEPEIKLVKRNRRYITDD